MEGHGTLTLFERDVELAVQAQEVARREAKRRAEAAGPTASDVDAAYGEESEEEEEEEAQPNGAVGMQRSSGLHRQASFAPATVQSQGGASPAPGAAGSVGDTAQGGSTSRGGDGLLRSEGRPQVPVLRYEGRFRRNKCDGMGACVWFRTREKVRATWGSDWRGRPTPVAVRDHRASWTPWRPSSPTLEREREREARAGVPGKQRVSPFRRAACRMRRWNGWTARRNA